MSATTTGGAPDGVPLLLLHPFPLSSEAFAAQMSLSARVIAPDHRGFGNGARTDGSAVTMEAYARDALAVLDQLGVERCVVGGVSMGGYVAMAILRIAPARVSGLILMDTKAGADDEDARAARETTAKKVLAEGLDPLIPGMLKRLVAPGSAATDQVEKLIRRAATPEGVASASRGMALRPDSRDTLKVYRGPTLVLFGEEDQFTGLDEARTLADLVPNATLVTIPNAGHLAHLEAPDEVNAALIDFLSRVA
jgi:pimeloyl-ACP methyl ester carboxylesterase